MFTMLLALFAAASLAAQSAPPPPADIGRARPARLREGWVSDDDYPAAAVAAGAEGSVTVRFLIDRSGRVAACDIVQSAGHPALDSVSCAIVVRRFRFDPARDREGRRVEEHRHQRFVWQLPDPEPEPATATD
jgi:protein TonB